MPAICDGSTPPSITDDTNAANSGGGAPGSLNSSGWMNDSPLNAWTFSTGPYMCAPHAVQAWRWISAALSTTASRSPPDSTSTFSLGTTATIEKIAPDGFQH